MAVRVIDIRDPKSYAAAHIPGAVNAPYGSWRGPASSPGELPELARLTAQVRRLGLTPATRAVVVSSGADATDFGAAARVYWTLKVLGLKELSVLNGGVKAWAAAGRTGDAIPYAFPVVGRRPLSLTRIDALMGAHSFDATTPITRDSWTASYWSAQSALAATDAVLAGERAAFALCRPPRSEEHTSELQSH